MYKETELKKIRRLLSAVYNKEIPTPKYITNELYRTPYDSHLTDVSIINGVPYRVEPGQGISKYEIEGFSDVSERIKRYLGKLYPTDEELIYLKNLERRNKITNNLYDESRKIQNELKTLPTIQDYSPERKTILRKYEKYPEMVQEVLGITPKIEIDRNGNSWYVIDVPENYLNSEQAYKKGGKLIPRKHN